MRSVRLLVLTLPHHVRRLRRNLYNYGTCGGKLCLGRVAQHSYLANPTATAPLTELTDQPGCARRQTAVAMTNSSATVAAMHPSRSTSQQAKPATIGTNQRAAPAWRICHAG